MRSRILVCLALAFASLGVHASIECGSVLTYGTTTLTSNLTCNGSAIYSSSQRSVLDCAGYTLTGNGSGFGVNVTESDHGEIRNCVIRNFSRGISLISSTNYTIANNTLTNNTYGIVIQKTDSSRITNNSVTRNQYHGLFTDTASGNNTLGDNSFCYNNRSNGSYFDVYNKGRRLDAETYPKFLEHIGVDITPYNSTTMLAGGIIFDPTFNTSDRKSRNLNRVFIEFGLLIEVGQPNEKTMPEMTYYLRHNASVYSIVNGTVHDVVYQALSDDYEIQIWLSEPYSNYVIFIDHVRNATVDVNDTVSSGDLLGKPGYLTDFDGVTNDPLHDGEQYGLVEFHVRANNYDYCLSRFFTDSVFPSVNESLTRLMSDWENYTGDDTVYNPATQSFIGCIVDELPPDVNQLANNGTANTCTTAFNFTDSGASAACADACPATTTTSTSTTSTSTTSTSTTLTSTTTICSNDYQCIGLINGWNLISIPFNI